MANQGVVDAVRGADGVETTPPSMIDPGVNIRTATAQLVRELRVAAAEACMDGFYRMARVLDESTLLLDGDAPLGRLEKRAVTERARQSLELWRALREW